MIDNICKHHGFVGCVDVLAWVVGAWEQFKSEKTDEKFNCDKGTAAWKKKEKRNVKAVKQPVHDLCSATICSNAVMRMITLSQSYVFIHYPHRL